MVEKYPALPAVVPSEMTTAELLVDPFRTTQFLRVPFVIGVVPLEPNQTTIGPVALVFSSVRSRVVPPTEFEPSIVM
jgi:hypothetical protein